MNNRKLIAGITALCIFGAACPVVNSGTLHSLTAAAEENDIAGTLAFTGKGDYQTITFSNVTEVPTWYSDNEEVAVVSGGTVTAVGNGEAFVYAVFSSQVLKFKVTVNIAEPQKQEINAGSVELSNDRPGVTVSLGEISLDGAEWSSSDVTVAAVDDKGGIIAVGAGSCEVRAVLGNITYIIKVTSTYVPADPVTEVELGSLLLTNEKNAVQITLSGLPDGAAVEWSSTDESVAKVDEKGNVYAVNSGKCQVIALIDGVKYITEVTSEYVPQTEHILGDMELSNAEFSKAIVLGNVPEGTVIVWSCDDETVAKVDDKGNVTAVGKGSCHVTALINGESYIMNVTSTYDPESVITVEGGSFTIEGIGNSLQLSLSDIPETPEWLSMNVNTATVSADGVVTAVGEGEAVILAKTSKAVYKVTVTVKAAKDILYGDANCSGEVEIADAVFIMQGLANPSAEQYIMTSQGKANADCYNTGDGVDAQDALAVQKYCADLAVLPIKN